MSVFNARIVNNGSCCISPRISDQSSANDNTQRLATTETTEQHGNVALFHFQNNQMWPVNMTGKTKGWPVNSQISSDIVRWPAVILSPALFGLRWILFLCSWAPVPVSMRYERGVSPCHVWEFFFKIGPSLNNFWSFYRIKLKCCTMAGINITKHLVILDH